MRGAKTGGRQKGTTNRRTAEVEAIVERLKCNPFEILCLFAIGDWKALGYQKPEATKENPNPSDPVIEPTLRMRAAGEASKYLYPQKRELSTGDEPIKIMIEDYRKPK